MGRSPWRGLAGLTGLGLAAGTVLASLALAYGPDHGYVDPLRGRPAHLPKGTQLLYVGGDARVHPIRPGFLGLSLEYPAVEAYAGTNAAAIDPVFLQLVRNLTAYQPALLRIGGDSTDSTWWPVRGLAQPKGIRYALTWRWLGVTRALVQALHARVILGVNLEADDVRIPWTEAVAFGTGLPGGSIEALEPGNEPELYGTWTYYRASDGRKMTGRPAGYTFRDFEADFARVQKAMPNVRLAGPTTGSRKWMADLNGFLGSERNLALVTLHRYPLQLCYIPRFSPRYPTLGHLLSPHSSRGLASIFAPYVGLAHAHGLQVRVDELNSVGCGYVPRVTDTFASALWALDTLFALAQQGVDGVNVHTFPGAAYELFNFSHAGGHWHGHVSPEYYGLLMFAVAAPAGSQPLNVSGPGASALSAWAVRAPDGRIRVVLINDHSHPETVGIRAGSGYAPVSPGSATGDASLIRLTGSSAASSSGVQIAGTSLGSTTYTGLLGTPHVTTVRPTGNAFVVQVPATSAVLLALP